MKPPLTCPHHPACSGCSSIGVAYAVQVERKLRTVRELFTRANLEGFDPESIRAITPSPSPGGYRNRAKLVPANGLGETCPRKRGHATQDAVQRVRLGLYREGSHEVVDIPGCPVQMDGINRALEVVRDALGWFNIPLYDEVTHTGHLRFITVRQGLRTSQLLIGLITRTPDCPGLEEIAEHLMRHCPGSIGVVQNINTEKGNVIFGPTTRLLAGRSFLEEMACNVRLRLGITSFFQVNTAVAEKAYEAIMAALDLGGEDTLLDLYSGVGAIGLAAAPRTRQVIGIEEVTEAIEFAVAACRANRIGNVTFQEGLVELRLPQLVADLCRQGITRKRLAVVVNPPRKGLDRRVVGQLLRVSAGRLAYLSCSPATLLRDLGRFVSGGYRVRHVGLFDMFPQTEQVETLAILEPQDEASDRPLRRARQRTK